MRMQWAEKRLYLDGVWPRGEHVERVNLLKCVVMFGNDPAIDVLCLNRNVIVAVFVVVDVIEALHLYSVNRLLLLSANAVFRLCDARRHHDTRIRHTLRRRTVYYKLSMSRFYCRSSKRSTQVRADDFYLTRLKTGRQERTCAAATTSTRLSPLVRCRLLNVYIIWAWALSRAQQRKRFPLTASCSLGGFASFHFFVCFFLRFSTSIFPRFLSFCFNSCALALAISVWWAAGTTSNDQAEKKEEKKKFNFLSFCSCANRYLRSKCEKWREREKERI